MKPFLLGFRFGMCILLFCWVLWDVVIDFWYNQYEADAEAAAQLERITHKCHTSSADKNISIAAQWFEKDFPVYRGMGSLIAWLWLWGVCLFVWTHARINYLFMFIWSICNIVVDCNNNWNSKLSNVFYMLA